MDFLNNRGTGAHKKESANRHIPVPLWFNKLKNK
jgi:hypothetical protein